MSVPFRCRRSHILRFATAPDKALMEAIRADFLSTLRWRSEADLSAEALKFTLPWTMVASLSE
jgi:hypothetical protein